MMNRAQFSPAPASFTHVFPSEAFLFPGRDWSARVSLIYWWKRADRALVVVAAIPGVEDAAPSFLQLNFGFPTLSWCCFCYFGESQFVCIWMCPCLQLCTGPEFGHPHHWKSKTTEKSAFFGSNINLWILSNLVLFFESGKVTVS